MLYSYQDLVDTWERLCIIMMMKICAVTLPARLSEHDIPSLCEQLRPYSSKWREIGTGLRFTASEQNMNAAIAGQPDNYN